MSIEDLIWFQIEARKRRLFLLFDQVGAHHLTWRANMIWLQSFSSQNFNWWIMLHEPKFVTWQPKWKGKACIFDHYSRKRKCVFSSEVDIVKTLRSTPRQWGFTWPTDGIPNRDWIICSSMNFPTEIKPCYNAYWIQAMIIARYYRLCHF